MGKTKLQKEFVPDYTAYRIEMAAQRIRDGCDLKDIADRTGFGRSTLYKWEREPEALRVRDLLAVMKAMHTKEEDQDRILLTLAKELRKLV